MREINGMINVKNHAKKRYVERIMGITDAQEVKVTMVEMDSRIVEYLNRMYENASFIYKGQIGDNTTKNYFLVDNVVLVTDVGNSCVITLFKCSFDFGEKMDRIIIENEIKEISGLHEDLNKIEAEINEFIEIKQTEAHTIELQLRAMEEQMKALRTIKASIDEQVDAKRASRTYAMKEIEKRALRICNSVEYRKDLKENAAS
jgi:hypothetical protein